MVDLEDVDLVRGDRTLLSHATWRLGPGDRVGLVGVNGAGKSSVLSLLSGELAPTAGRVRRGRTVALEHLTQSVDPEVSGEGLPADARVLATVESVRRVTRTLDGDVTASSMLERFGFTGDRLTARLGDLSGGERRRFQLLLLLLAEPNVLLLDEPTNDLDIETLNVLEDFLDDWPGTLVVVSHDRYFLERVCDTVWALLDDGQVSLLPRGVDEYLERRAAALRAQRSADTAAAGSAPATPAGRGQRRRAQRPQDDGPPGPTAGAGGRAGGRLVDGDGHALRRLRAAGGPLRGRRRPPAEREALETAWLRRRRGWSSPRPGRGAACGMAQTEAPGPVSLRFVPKPQRVGRRGRPDRPGMPNGHKPQLRGRFRCGLCPNRNPPRGAGQPANGASRGRRRDGSWSGPGRTGRPAVGSRRRAAPRTHRRPPSSRPG